MDRLNKTINKLYLLRKHIRHLYAKKMDLVYEISTNLHPSVTTRNQFLLLDYCLIPTMEQIFNREKEYLAQALEKVGEESFSIEITPDFVEECADTMLKEEKATEED